jgi:MFS family permease
LLTIFICVLLVGMPAWFSNGVLITFTREIAGSMHMAQLPSAATVISFYFLGFAFGDPCCGLLSQYLKSRKKAILIFLILYTFTLLLFFNIGGFSLGTYYALFTAMGFSVGFTIMLFTLAAEQFGTNIRALVTSTTLNLTRAWVIPLTFCFTILAEQLQQEYLLSAAIIAGVVLTLAFIALSQLDETYHRDLDFHDD